MNQPREKRTESPAASQQLLRRTIHFSAVSISDSLARSRIYLPWHVPKSGGPRRAGRSHDPRPHRHPQQPEPAVSGSRPIIVISLTAASAAEVPDAVLRFRPAPRQPAVALGLPRSDTCPARIRLVAQNRIETIRATLKRSGCSSAAPVEGSSRRVRSPIAAERICRLNGRCRAGPVQAGHQTRSAQRGLQGRRRSRPETVS